MIETQTDRLLLRRFTTADAERMFEIYSDRETMKFMGRGPETVEDERGAIERHYENYYDKYGFGLWAVVLESEGSVIGRCGIVRQEVDGEHFEELSYLIDRRYWGHGYATEAAHAVIRQATDKYDLKKLAALILPANTASIRVAEKCGFELKREIPQFKIWKDVRLYSKVLSRD